MSKIQRAGGLVCVNGQLLPSDAPHISALDRGFALSDGVFETLRVIDGLPFRLSDHLARLRESARTLRLAVPDPDHELVEAIRRVVAVNGQRDAIVRITVSRGVPTERGLLPPAHPSPTVVVQCSPYHGLSAAQIERGYALHTSSIRRNEWSPTSRVKSCNYLDNILARLEARDAGANEALLLNTAGELACCSSANLHIVSDGQVLTPMVECGVLAGITRQALCEIAEDLGVNWFERRLAYDDLAAAEEAFMTNSVIGVVPVTALDRRPLGGGRIGPITRLLVQEYQSHLNRRVGAG